MIKVKVTKISQQEADEWTKKNSYQTKSRGMFTPTPYMIDREAMFKDQEFLEQVFRPDMIKAKDRLVAQQTNHLTNWFLIEKE